ncbi:MAG: cobalamin-dependent protein [Chloroflexota bacterium]
MESHGAHGIKVVAAMTGLDCHDRGLIYLTSVLRNAGMEVVYLGMFNTPERVVKTAIQEDADVIALSYLNDHLYMLHFPRVVELLKEKGAGHIAVVTGGRIAKEDRPRLAALGISGFFGQEATDEEMVAHIQQRVAGRRRAGSSRTGH